MRGHECMPCHIDPEFGGTGGHKRKQEARAVSATRPQHGVFVICPPNQKCNGVEPELSPLIVRGEPAAGRSRAASRNPTQKAIPKSINSDQHPERQVYHA